MTYCDSVVAVFDVDGAALRTLIPQLAATPPDFATSAIEPKLVAEIVRFGDAAFAILLSTASVDDFSRLRCWLALCNDVPRCDALRGKGLPVVEAAVEENGRHLTFIANHYRHGDLALTWSPLLTIDGIDFAAVSASTSRSSRGTGVTFEQYLPRPDLLRPGFDIVGEPSAWTWSRRLVPSTRKLALTFEDALFPNFNTLWSNASGGPRRPQTLFASRFSDPLDQQHSVSAARPTPAPVRLTKATTIGEPHYRFEDMELLGFRIDLPPAAADTVADLASLVRPLNFHLDRRAADREIEDFEYRIATRSIIVELIRYGKMKYAGDAGPLSKDTYMSQHELLVRVLVGRVDQGASQAREAATYVHAIFVDNPTSKAVGREMQGYPKLLAAFCRTNGDGGLQALPQNGRLDDGTLAPLASINTLVLATRMASLSNDRVLELSYSIPQFDDDFLALDDGLFSGIDAIAGFPWRHNDFDDPAFRRSFARDVVNDGLRRSRSVQVIPVHRAGNEPQTWLTGTYALTNIRFQQPSGIATLRFHAPEGMAETAPNWFDLCRLFSTPSGTSEVNLPSGSWYRVKCDMDLTINDGLAWD